MSAGAAVSPDNTRLANLGECAFRALPAALSFVMRMGLLSALAFDVYLFLFPLPIRSPFKAGLTVPVLFMRREAHAVSLIEELTP